VDWSASVGFSPCEKIGEYKIEDIDMCVYNNDNEDPLFKKHVLSQSFMLKGTKNELKK